jgi:anti-sigma factor RsiW
VIHARHKRLLSEYLDGSLMGRPKARLERHLAECAECRGELAELRGTVLLVRQLATPEEEPSDFLATRILARIEAGETSPRWTDRARAAAHALLSGPWAPAAIAVTVLFVVATALRIEIRVKLPSSEPPELASAEAVVPVSEAVAPEVLAGEIRLVRTPAASRHRFDPVVLDAVAGVDRACAAIPHDDECQTFRNKLVTLALGNPPGFVRQIESFPVESRDRVLSAVSVEAARTGHVERVLRSLRSIDDPRAYGIVVHLERTVASRE